MHAQSYLQSRQNHPAGLAAAIALNGAAVAALVMFQPQLPERIATVLKLIPIKADPAVPRPENPPPPKRERTVIKRVDRVIAPPDHSEAGTVIASNEGDFPIKLGGGTGEIVLPPPIRDPVTLKASWNSRYAEQLQPPYPPALQRMEVEGTVKVRILVGVDGRAKDIVAVSSDNDAFFAATRAWGLKHWRFTPETRDGEPVESWLTTTVRFRLER